jgi:GTPase SAR1 family protein
MTDYRLGERHGRLQIWDTAGQERIHSISQTFCE